MKGKNIFFDKNGLSRPEFRDFHALLIDIFDRDSAPDEFLENLSKNPADKTRMLNAIQQGKEVLKMKDFPWEYIHYNANDYLLEENENAVRSWLTNILSTIEHSASSE